MSVTRLHQASRLITNDFFGPTFAKLILHAFALMNMVCKPELISRPNDLTTTLTSKNSTA